MRPTWTKVYTGPGYPEDLARAERRMLEWAAKPPPWPNPDALLRCQLSDPDGMNQRLMSAPGPDMLTDRATAEKFISEAPHIFQWWKPK